MVIRLTNEEYDLSTEFWDFSEWLAKDIRINKHDMSKLCETNSAFWLTGSAGLASGGYSVSNTDASAINSDGQTFRRNSWSPLTFSISFVPVTFIKLYQTLLMTVRYKNAPLLVEVLYGANTYMQYFQIEDIDLEGGSITFTSAYPNEGTFWYMGDKVISRNPVGARYTTSYEGSRGVANAQNYVEGGGTNSVGVHNYNNIWIEQTIEQGVIIDIPAGVEGQIVVKNNHSGEYFKQICEPDKSYQLDTVNLKYYVDGEDMTDSYTGAWPTLTPGKTNWYFAWIDLDADGNPTTYEEDTLINGLKPCDYASEIEWKWSITYGNFAAGISTH